MLVGIQNNGVTPIEIKNLTGAFIDESGDTLIYAQNFSLDSYDGAVILPSASFSIAFEFFAFTSI